eukprot:10176150-Lingulodinium_polyedra.AAC.1
MASIRSLARFLTRSLARSRAPSRAWPRARAHAPSLAATVFGPFAPAFPRAVAPDLARGLGR